MLPTGIGGGPQQRLRVIQKRASAPASDPTQIQGPPSLGSHPLILSITRAQITSSHSGSIIRAQITRARLPRRKLASPGCPSSPLASTSSNNVGHSQLHPPRGRVAKSHPLILSITRAQITSSHSGSITRAQITRAQITSSHSGSVTRAPSLGPRSPGLRSASLSPLGPRSRPFIRW